jgi:hypothetical protein
MQATSIIPPSTVGEEPIMNHKESPDSGDATEAAETPTQPGRETKQDPLEEALDIAPHIDPDIASQADGLP